MMFMDPYDDFHKRGTGPDSELYWAGITHYAYYCAGRVAECTCMNCRKKSESTTGEKP